MRKRMYLQLFEDGAGAGSGRQGGNAGDGNSGQNGNAGNGTYTYEQLEEIASARAQRSERAALATFFRGQGMTEEEVTQAINAFKTQRAANQPDATKLQQDLDSANQKI